VAGQGQDAGGPPPPELQRDLDNGVIDAEQFEQAKADLERGMAEDVLLAEEEGPRRVGRGPLIAATAAVLVIVPAVSVGLYQELGGGLAALDPEHVPPPVASEEHQQVDIEAMVAQLAERMKDNPDDIEGWFMLGRSYQFLNRYEEAKAAYDRVLALGGESSPDFLATYADQGPVAGRDRWFPTGRLFHGPEVLGAPRPSTAARLRGCPHHPGQRERPAGAAGHGTHARAHRRGWRAGERRGGDRPRLA